MSTDPRQFAERFAEFVRATPVDDLKRNAQTWFAARLAELDLVPRTEFDQQAALLARAEARLAALETKVAQIEAGRGPSA